MSDQLIGPGPTCWECGIRYGQHADHCSIGKAKQAEREAEQRKAIVRDCDHDWQANGLALVKADRSGIVIQCNQIIEVLACSKCGLLRMP